MKLCAQLNAIARLATALHQPTVPGFLPRLSAGRHASIIVRFDGRDPFLALCHFIEPLSTTNLISPSRESILEKALQSPLPSGPFRF
jgi:hypothetical protein